MKKNNNKVSIELRDNGKGLQEIQEKESFGMLLMNTMLQQLNADYDMYNDDGFVLIAKFDID
jgi:two-component sensor histidine kinase